MIPGTGIPSTSATLEKGRLSGPPVLVQITAMTDIGHSAFSLYNTRQIRIEKDDLAGLAEQDGGEDDGPIPKYPRSMLRFSLSDGSVTFPAIEFKRIPQLELGETPHGFKVCFCPQYRLLSDLQAISRYNYEIPGLGEE